MAGSEKPLHSPMISSSFHPHKPQQMNINLNTTCFLWKFSLPSNQIARPKAVYYRNFGYAI